MRIYLLNPPYLPHFGRGARWQDTGRGGTLYYPIWLSYAAAVLQDENEIRLVDAPAINLDRDGVLKDIASFGPDLVVIDSSFPSLNNDISVAEAIKNECCNSSVILVGPPASQLADKILEKNIDFVARYEYDFTIKDLALAIDHGRSIAEIKGISFKDKGKVIHNPNRSYTNSKDLDEIPFVSKIYKKFLNIDNYFLGQSLYPEVQIFTGRGCPNHCTFCSWPATLMGRTYRVRSISNVLDEIEWVQENLKIKEIFFEDDTFTILKKRVLEFCKGYNERRLWLPWSCNARVDTLDLETMKQMKKANCRLLIAGFESGNDEILRNIKKNVTIDQIKQFSKDVKKAKLLLHGDVIIGLPGETKSTIKDTERLIKETKPDILQVAVASPFPGTAFYNYCYNNNYLITDDPNEYLDINGHQKAVISYPEITNEDMAKEADRILKDYYLSLGYLPIAFNQVWRRNSLDEFHRLWFSAKMFLGYVSCR